LQAAVVTLAVRNRVSRRDTTELVRELFGVELSTGSVDAIIQRAGVALAGPHTELELRIKAASVVNIDETGWKTGGDKRTLWAALTSLTAVFRIAPSRHASEAKTLLGERFKGIVCSDRYPGYDYLDPAQRQICWAHLARDFTAHSEGMSEQKQFGEACLEVAGELFTAWDAYQEDGDRGQLQARTLLLQDTLRTLLERADRKSPRTRYHRAFARNLLKRWAGLWTFPPTHTAWSQPTTTSLA
jgi:transposase